jgi:CTP:molybdopterin cytidylyltransferase MocA
LDELLDINEETLGIKAVVQRHHESVRRVEVGIPEVLWDMNTPEQYEAVLKAAI